MYQALLLIEAIGGSKNAKYIKYIPIVKPIFDLLKAEGQGSEMRDVAL